MGISSKSHDKKSDKECQSPMLKLFKDMQNNEEPEKTKLLKQKEERKKRKKSSVSRVKSGEIIEQKFHYDSRSSVSEEYNPKSKMVDDKTYEKEYSQCRTKCYPFREEKKESWRFWKDKSKSGADTCSCVSCALENMLNTQCLGIYCLISVFVAFVVFVFCLVFRTSMPMDCMDETMVYKKDTNFGRGLSRNRNIYRKDINGLSGYVGPDVTDSFRETRNSEDSELALNGLPSALNNNIMKHDPNSEKLRNFYNKIVQTDAQIQLLKKANQYDMAGSEGDMFALKRVKRSVKFNDKNHQNKGYFVKKRNNKREGGTFISKRGKRNDPQPTGFVIERKKFIVQYNPAEVKHKVPKCSHAPKEQKSHEKQLKHPFYKNTQRLDELLDKMIEHNVRYDVANPVFLEKLLKDSEPDERTKMAKSDADSSFFGVKPAIKNVKVTTKAIKGIEENSLYDMKKMMSTYGDFEGEQVELTTKLDFDGVKLSGSKLMDRIGNVPSGAEVFDTALNMRKLMQFDDSNEEDRDEMKFFDYSETPNDKEQADSRKKRMDYETDIITSKYKLPNLYNANWKGPMPLYPDEINILIKQVAMRNLNFELPKPLQLGEAMKRGGTDYEDEAKLSDTEYVDGNENARYERMAQAYSDYGVLDSKQESTESNKEYEVITKNIDFVMNKKMSPGLDRLKKDYNKDSNTVADKEGFKFSISKTGKAEDKPLEIMNQLRKHVKFLHDNSKSHAASHNLPMDATPSADSGDSNGGHNLNAIKRSLKSLDTDEVGVEVNETFDEKNDEHVKILSHIIFVQGKTMGDLKLKNESNETLMYVNNNNKTEYYAADTATEFLTMISNWFQMFSAFIFNKNSIDVSKLSSNTTTNASKVFGELKTKGSIDFPNYDADMIENIGHRSRALLSVDDHNNASAKKVSDRDNKKLSSGYKEEINAAKNAVLMKNATNTINLHTTERHGNMSTDIIVLFSKNGSDRVENRSVVKRDVETNSNFIFWNDMYDDEYGVRTDPLDSLRDKHSTNSSDILMKSQRWFERKVKMLSNIMRKPKKLRSVDPRFGKSRRARGIFRKDYHGLDFRSLTDNMKEVCREAMQALQSTKNIEVREDNKDYAVASSLMQQLVKLMSDLVDYQVQQKTCQKLPPDLHSFLEWLVAENDQQNVPVKSELQFPAINDVNLDASTIKDISIDNFRYRDALKTVQDLIKQYEGFSDADKNKLTGVREYLQNQLEYLQSQVAIGGDSMSSFYVNPYLPIRERRNLSKKRHAKNILQKYVKYFEKTTPKSSKTIQDGGSDFTSHSNLESTMRPL